jgi:steroid delta-isomerase-like uncharacterized protein
MANADSVLQRYVEELWNQGNVELADELFTEDFVRHGPQAEGGDAHGRDGFKAVANAWLTGLPDLHVELHEVREDGERAFARWTVSGTNTGGVLGQEANGNSFSIAGQWFLHLRDGRIAKEWVLYDTLALVQQLKLQIPTPATA